jgi:Leucine-rich repeat (LRR) protein
LPPEIGQLTALEGIELYSNRLTDLPPEIMKLTSLKQLYIGANRLCSLPDSIEAWIDLRISDWRESQDCGPEGCADTDYLEYNPFATVHVQDSCKTLGVGKNFNKSGSIDFQNNPFSNSITITFPNSTTSKSISIYTLKGTLVKQFRTTASTVTWNVRESGVYYIRAVVDGKTVVGKVVL